MDKNIVSLRKESIIIDFEKLFNRKLSHFNEFKITKRSYHKKLPIMFPVIKEFIEDKECTDYAYNILYFKYLLNSKEEEIKAKREEGGDDSDKEPEILIERTEVIEFLKEKIFSDEKLINFINQEVDSEYKLTLDDSINEKNENLQITDDLNKKYLKAAMLMRLLLPFVSALSDKITTIETLDEYIFDMFTECILFMNDYDGIILKKIFNIVSSRIIQTRYSDKDIWDFLEKQNKDIIITIRNFNNYILINNFLKIMNNKSIISYIDVVLKNKIGYLFTLNYKVSHKTLDYHAATNNNSDNSLTEIDKLEATLLRKDKGLSFINEQSIKLEVNKIISKYSLEEEMLDEFKDSVSFNRFTRIFLSIFYKKKFDIIFEDNYTYPLMFHMLSVLRQKGFSLIPQIAISEESSVRTHNKRLIKEKLSDSVKYKLLLAKYQDVENLVSKDRNFINELIASIKQKRFIDNESNEELVLDIEILNEEILDFLYM